MPTKVYHWMQLLQVDVIFNWMESSIWRLSYFLWMKVPQNQSQSKAKNIGLGRCHLSS
jgi:hypothetical protein